MKYQKGFSLVEITIVLGILAALSISISEMKREADDIDRAKAVGIQIAEFESAVQKFVSYNEHGGVTLSSFLTSSGNTSEATALVMNNTMWLKKNLAVSCVIGLQGTGNYTADQSFLPCRFPNSTKFKQNYSTRLWFNAGTGAVEAKTIIASGSVRGQTRGDLTPYIAKAIASSTAGSATSDDSIFTVEFIKSPDSDSANSTIELHVTNSSSLSSWLRVDGSNAMMADLNLGGNDLVNAQNATFSERVTTRHLTVDETASVQTLNVSGSTTIGDNLSIANDLIVSAGNIVVQAGNISASNGLTVTGAGDLELMNGKIVLRNATPSIEFTELGGINRADLTLTSNNEVTLGFNSPDGVFNVDGDVYNQAIDKFSSQAVYDVTIAANGDMITKPSCPTGKTPQILLSMAGFSRNDAVKPVGAVSTFAVDNGLNWTVYLELRDEDGVHGGVGGLNASFPNISILAIKKCT